MPYIIVKKQYIAFRFLNIALWRQTLGGTVSFPPF
ncbi:hypothetical protein B23_3660 [Geobacillus thermoleovorans B23]|nr:hypothetical protein B23_3660 [Geobacillus thermoleovorans B23]